ncbi:hypothetical protein LTS18_005664 [Coniosporium uncinatum]|uniref:Uncharacterized protein n=1 Tax=Coniosporium uncinatum TaxID=93489 RepID=A0ACC3DAW6_9PEZI|nr:hypothetical protein LTS18_005664 [Coniosporium uncinatum]
MSPSATPGLSEVHNNKQSGRAIHLHESFDRTARECPDKVAIISRHQPSDLYKDIVGITPGNSTCLRWTWHTLHRAVLRLAASLHEHGICKGTAIATFLPNGVEWLITAWACYHLGCPFVPISMRNLSNREELAYMLQVTDVQVVVAHNNEVAQGVQEVIREANLTLILGVVVEAQNASSLWYSFPELLNLRPNTDASLFKQATPTHADTDVSTVFFTSGTTSLPKGCALTNGILATTYSGFAANMNVSPTSIVCNSMPNNHAMGAYFTLLFLYARATVVYPSVAFDPKTVLTALREERCTHTAFVPTMLYAIISLLPADGGGKLEDMELVALGGASVTMQNAKECVEKLGARMICSGYGMSEGCPLRPFPSTDPEKLMRHGAIISGDCVSGAKIRVCEPGTTNVVPIGEAGELHHAGSTIIRGYLGDRNPEDFYTEDGETWFRTGDQVIMAPDGLVTIVGRYKDMIIRGGENISPSAMERVLSDIKGVEVQVVGVTDDIAGEVPVMVYGGRRVRSKYFQEIALKTMGKMYVPAECIHLEDLGLTDFPKNTNGKVQKTKLAGLVKDWRTAREVVVEPQAEGLSNGEARSHSSTNSRDHVVVRTWASLIGIPASEINLRSSTDEFADSISIMRFRDRVKKATGKTLSPEEVFSSTIAQQIELLDNRSQPVQSKSTPLVLVRNGPPTAADMIHTQGSSERAKTSKQVVESTIGKFGLSWNDEVADVVPAYGTGQVIFTYRRPLSWGFRFVINTLHNNPQTVRTALEATLSKHAILTSFFVREGGSPTDRSSEALHVLLRPSSRVFNHMIGISDVTVDKAEELEWFADDERLDASFPGPMLQATIVPVESSSTVGIVINANHATFDAMSIQTLFFDDLDTALRDPTLLQDHVPYKVWADTYYSLRTSPAAQEAVAWHLQRLRGLEEHEAALWPKKRFQEWMWGSRRGAFPVQSLTHESSIGGDVFENPTGEPLEEEELRSDTTAGITLRFSVHTLNALRKSVPGLTNPSIAKAALALVNVLHTGHSHALFSSLEAGRSAGLPFLPESVKPFVDVNCADISGPIFSWTADLLRVDPEEELGSFLARVQETQN